MASQANNTQDIPPKQAAPQAQTNAQALTKKVVSTIQNPATGASNHLAGTKVAQADKATTDTEAIKQHAANYLTQVHGIYVPKSYGVA